MPRFEARDKVTARLQILNLLRSIKDHEMVLPICSRSGDVLEPFLKEQWFANSSELFKICSTSIKDGSLQLIPDNRKNLWNHYVNTFINKDWCISRQLWWGQRIPAYKCHVKNLPGIYKWFAAKSAKEAVEQAAKHFNAQDIEVHQGLKFVSFIE
jgi:valyl-tRNA synthetase